VTVPSGPGQAGRAADGKRQRRMRSTDRLRIDRNAVDLPVSPTKLDRLVRPGPQQDLDALLEARAALVLGDAVAKELDRSIAAAQPDRQPAATQDVERGGFLGQPQRMMEG